MQYRCTQTRAHTTAHIEHTQLACRDILSAHPPPPQATHGSAQIRLRLRTPLAGRQFTSVEELITFFAPVHPNAHLLPPPATPALYELMPQSPPTQPAAMAPPPVATPIAVAAAAPPAVVIPPPPAAKPPPPPAAKSELTTATATAAAATAAAATVTPSLPVPATATPTRPPPAASAETPVAPEPPAAVATPQPATQNAAPAVVPAPAAAKPKAAAPVAAAVPKSTPAPAKKAAAAAATTDDELDIEEWESAENMVSNNVLEAEFTSVTKQIDTLQAQRKIVPDDLADRKNAIEIKMKLLMLSVQTGKLSLEDYMAQLKQRAEAERKFAAKCVALKTAEGKEAAKRALIRAKVMEAEMTESAEEGGGEQ